MNPVVLPMMPMTNSNQTKPSQSAAISTAKFGAVLESAVSKGIVGTKSDSGQTILTPEQTEVIQVILKFLKMNSLSDVNAGNPVSEKLLMDENFGESDPQLQLLLKLNGGDETAAAEFLASISNLNLSASEEHKPLLSGISSELYTALAQLINGNNQQEPITNEDVNQQLLGNSQKLDTTIREQTFKEVRDGQVDIQDMNQLLTEISPELYSTLAELNSLDVKDMAKLDLKDTANLLKLAKLQDLLSSHKDMTENEAMMQKEIKNLLESLTGKLEKWLGNQSLKNENVSFALLLENGTNKSLAVVKQVYARVLRAVGETSDETLSKGLTLNTTETNTQSSGIPFQMTKLEQLVLTAGKNGQPVDQEQFVKSFENILSKANFSNVNGMQKLLIRLNPEHLGSLRIELIQKDGAMVAKILATTSQAKDLLDRQVQGLKQAFTNQNIQVEKIEISQQMSTFNAERFAQRDGGHNEQRHQQPQKNETNEDTETDFADRFTEAILNLEV